MWDNDALLRIITNAMLNFSLVAGLFGAGYYLLHLPGTFPIYSVQLSDAPQHVAAEQVLKVLRKSVQGNLLTVDLEHVRNGLEELPWVRLVSIRREFPSRLMVSLEEHQVLARWNDNGFVNLQGEVFVAEYKKSKLGMVAGYAKTLFADAEDVLPDFIGPEGSSVEVMGQHMQFSKQLIELDLSVEQLVLSPRHAWQAHLSNGMILELGREDMQQRLARFVAVYPYSLVTQNIGDKSRQATGVAAYVDLRYRNGFAVRRSVSEKG